MASDTTRTLARIAGPFLVLTGAALVLKRALLSDTLQALQDPTAAFLMGLVALLVGLTMLVLHHRWKSPIQIVLSALGALLILRGTVLLLAPGLVLAVAAHLRPVLDAAWAVGLAAGLLGLWIAYEGFRKTTTTT